MQLDRPSIEIRERGSVEVFDISLHVFARFWKPILITMTIGVVPFAVLNHFLLYPMLDLQSESFPGRYFVNMIWLVVLESQFASIFATAHIGSLIFNSRHTIRDSVKSAWHSIPRAFWVHGMLRLIVPALLYYVYIWFERDYNQVFWNERMLIEFLLLPMVIGLALFIRAFRPFATELLVLEKNPMFQKTGAISFGKRSQALHTRGGDLFAHSFLTNVIGIMLFLSIFGGMLTLLGGISESGSHTLLVTIVLPLCLWVVATFVFITRLMNYLDTRTIQEGWEVELKLKAEAERL